MLHCGFRVTTPCASAKIVSFFPCLRYVSHWRDPSRVTRVPGKPDHGRAFFGWQSKQETKMSKSIKLSFALGVVALAAACAKQPEPEYVEVAPAPISHEPVYTGKYK